MPKRTQHPKEHDAGTTGTTEQSSTPTTRQRRKPGPVPGTDAAKRGGTAAREKYGRDFYRRIGSKGGSTVRERHGSSFYTQIGRLGGEATKRNLGREHYARIGRIGGQRTHGGQSSDRATSRSDGANSTPQ